MGGWCPLGRQQDVRWQPADPPVLKLYVHQPCLSSALNVAMLLSLHCTALLSAGRVLNEVEIDEELTGRRAKQAGFVEPSFPTIAGTGLGW